MKMCLIKMNIFIFAELFSTLEPKYVVGQSLQIMNGRKMKNKFYNHYRNFLIPAYTFI